MNNNKTILQMRNLISCNPASSIITDIYKYLKDKYGEIVIAGGSMTDLLYRKNDFYDIDVFVSYNELLSEWQDKISKKDSKRRICEVFRDEYNGLDVDIIVVGMDVYSYINHFDMNLKIIYFDGEFNISKKATKDYIKGEISLNSCENTNEWYRLWKASHKYNLKINKVDKFILENYLSVIGKDNIKVSDKYKKYLQYFKPLDNYSIALANITNRYMNRNYKCKSKFTFINFKLLKLIAMPYIVSRKLTENRD